MKVLSFGLILLSCQGEHKFVEYWTNMKYTAPKKDINEYQCESRKLCVEKFCPTC